MRMNWNKKEHMNTHRRLGEKYVWNLLNAKAPRQKQPSEARDFFHLSDSDGAAMPRPMKTVFPALRPVSYAKI